MRGSQHRRSPTPSEGDTLAMHNVVQEGLPARQCLVYGLAAAAPDATTVTVVTQECKDTWALTAAAGAVPSVRGADLACARGSVLTVRALSTKLGEHNTVTRNPTRKGSCGISQPSGQQSTQFHAGLHVVLLRTDGALARHVGS